MSEHFFYKCPPGCEKPHCQFCHGGLAFCEVCKCGEGELPTECPGRPVNMDTREDIYSGLMDYKNGEWIEK